jgi:enterochelin esterase-like enzyme
MQRPNGRISAATFLALAIFAGTAPLSGPAFSQEPSARSVQSKGAIRDSWITQRIEGPGLSFVTYDSTAAKAPVSFHVYLPPQYAREPERRFPVLYWLHGSGGGVRGIAPLTAHFDAAIAQGKIAPMIVVFPNGLAASMWTDSADGRWPVETMLIREILPHVDTNYRTIAGPQGRIIEGFSMGGHGAARIGFKHPGLFGAISMLAAGPLDPDFSGPKARANPAMRRRLLDDVHGGSLDRYRAENPWALSALRARQGSEGGPFRQVIGAADFTAEDNRRFQRHLGEQGIAHDFVEVPGVGHDVLALFAAMGEQNWAFYRQVTGAP